MRRMICKWRGHKWKAWPGSSGSSYEGFAYTCKRCGMVGTA